MKKLLSFILLTCLMSVSSVNAYKICGWLGSNQVDCSAAGDYIWDSFYSTVSGDLHINSYVSGSNAYTTASWVSNGPSYYYYGAGSSNPAYHVDPLAQPGNIQLFVSATSSGESGYIMAYW
jgi:hypothetical protein